MLYRHPLAAEGAWSPVEIEGHKVHALESARDGFVLVTDDRRVVRATRALEKTSVSTQALEGDRPMSIASGERGCAFLTDARGRVCTLTADALQCSGLRTLGTDRSWPLADFDRVDDKLWYATSSTAFYRSKDGAKTWERMLEGDTSGGLFASEDGSSVTLEIDGALSRWESGKPGVQPVLKHAEHEQVPSLCARHGRLWIADSFETDGSEEATSMLHRSDTVLEGDAFTALVYASFDEGRTWKPVDRCRGSIVHAVWLGQDDVLTLCMSDGSMRSGRFDAATATVAAPGFVTIAPASTALGGEFATWLAFPTSDEGWVGGMEYFGGARVHRSRDAGRSWELVSSTKRGDEAPIIEAFRLGRGICARIVGLWDESSRAEVWRDGDFQESRKFEHPANDARVDAHGSLLVRLEDGDVWSSSPDGAEWKKVAHIVVPPR